MVQPPRWYKIAEVSETELENWQQGDVFVGETPGTLFFRVVWKAELPAVLHETHVTESNPYYSVYTVWRSTLISMEVSGFTHEIRIDQSFPGIWVFTSAGIMLTHQTYNEIMITIGFRLNPPPSWFSPLSSLQNVIVNNTFGISSDARADNTISSFPYHPIKEITADGKINDWGDVSNLTLDVFPTYTSDNLGAVVNASAFASDTQLAFLIVLAQNESTIRLTYPNLSFSANLVAGVGWYSSDEFNSYNCNFHLDGTNRSLIIYVYDTPEGGYAREEFEVDDNQWAFGNVFECYLDDSQAISFYDHYPGEDYYVYVSSNFEWTYRLASVTSSLNSSLIINLIDYTKYQLKGSLQFFIYRIFETSRLHNLMY
ncbi:MAG: hypothetical protein ACFFCH_09300 [Promethearchaeota archaeon]